MFPLHQIMVTGSGGPTAAQDSWKGALGGTARSLGSTVKNGTPTGERSGGQSDQLQATSYPHDKFTTTRSPLGKVPLATLGKSLHVFIGAGLQGQTSESSDSGEAQSQGDG